MQNVTPTFLQNSTNALRKPIGKVRIAWTRSKDENIDFATVGTSLVGGSDIIKGELGVITQPDLFEYADETGILAISVDREVLEPVGGLSYARGTVVLDNSDKRFVPGFNPTIGEYIIPNRPIKVYMGFKGDTEELIPIMYGISESPESDLKKRTTKVSFFDYLAYIDGYELETTKYTNKRTDEILEDLLDTMGFVPEQFNLDEGLNTVGFAYYEKGTRAGDAIRELVQAEEGFFYQDELGLLRFESRQRYLVAPYTENQYSIDSSQILEWKELSNTEIINRVEVTAYPREVQDTTEIWKAGNSVEIANGATNYEIWASFENPADSIEDILEDVDYEANTASDGSGSDITDDISITLTKFVTSCKLSITNSYAGTAYLTLLRLRGNPAVIVSEIQEIYEDTDSQEQFGVFKKSIRNDKITSEEFAEYMARIIVEKYKSGLRRIEIKLPAMPQLQIGDKVTVTDYDTNEDIEMRVMRIQLILDTAGFLQVLRLREISETESDVEL